NRDKGWKNGWSSSKPSEDVSARTKTIVAFRGAKGDNCFCAMLRGSTLNGRGFRYVEVPRPSFLQAEGLEDCSPGQALRAALGPSSIPRRTLKECRKAVRRSFLHSFRVRSRFAIYPGRRCACPGLESCRLSA